MQSLSKKDTEAIKEAIRNAELKTSGEVVTVLLSKSDQYVYTHYLSALIFTLISVAITNYNLIDLEINHLFISCIFSIIGFLLPLWSPYKRLLLTANETNEEVRQRTLEAFFSNNLHQTKDSTGVLIFISLLERRINIIGDKGINQKVDQNFWDNEVEVLSQSIKSKKIISGLTKVIVDIGDKLEEHFPIKADDQNELKNELVTDLKII